MITRGDLLWLGISSSVFGTLTGGLLLGLGLGLLGDGQPIGLLLITPAAPIAGGVGWLIARNMAKKLAQPG